MLLADINTRTGIKRHTLINNNQVAGLSSIQPLELSFLKQCPIIADIWVKGNQWVNKHLSTKLPRQIHRYRMHPR